MVLLGLGFNFTSVVTRKVSLIFDRCNVLHHYVITLR